MFVISDINNKIATVSFRRQIRKKKKTGLWTELKKSTLCLLTCANDNPTRIRSIKGRKSIH